MQKLTSNLSLIKINGSRFINTCMDIKVLAVSLLNKTNFRNAIIKIDLFSYNLEFIGFWSLSEID